MRIALAVLVVLSGVASLAYLGLWSPPATGDGRIDVKADTPPAPRAEPAKESPPPDTVKTPPKRPFAAGDAKRPERSLAGRASSSAVEALRGNRGGTVVPEEILGQLEEALRNNDTRRARELTQQLVRAMRDGSLDEDKTIARVIALLEDGHDISTLRGMIPQLGYLKNDKLSEFFRDQYWATEDLDSRRLFINALRQGAGKESIPFLQQVLSDENNQQLRNQALFILSRVGTDESLGMLEDTIRSGSGVDRQTALQLISNRRDPKHADLFEEVLTGEAEPKMKEVAIRGLQQVGGSSAISILERIRDDSNSGEYVKNLARIAVQAIINRQNRGNRDGGNRLRDLDRDE